MPATKIEEWNTRSIKNEVNNQRILKKQKHKKAKPTYNLKTPLRRQEEGEISNGRTFS